jgi:hypothetical protein
MVETLMISRDLERGGSRLAIRADSLKREPMHPIRIQACAWCSKDEMHVPLQDCLSCAHNRHDDESVWCSWAPVEKPCEGCGIPAGLCEPETCLIAQAIKKAAM